MRHRLALLIVLLFGLAGCASIPLSTALSLSSLTPQDLAQIDPAALRVRLSVPQGFELDVPATRLSLSLSGPESEHSEEMGLALLGTLDESRDGGWFGAEILVTTYLLALDDAGADRLRRLQLTVLTSDRRTSRFSVSSPFSRVPPEADEVSFWADLRLAHDLPFMTLFDGARIRFERDPEES